MGAKKAREPAPEEEPEPSRAAGGCVLVVACGVPIAAVWAVSPEAGLLTLWAVGVLALRRAARRRVSDMPATPPPEEGRPSCAECAGHELVSVTPLGTQKGMLIYKTASADRPNHTHIHIHGTREEVNGS